MIGQGIPRILTPGLAYDELADEYDQSYKAPMWQAEDAVVYGLLRGFLPEEAKVVDMGCGTGALLDHVPLRRGQYFGIDISPRMIRKAWHKHPQGMFLLSPMEDMECLLSGGFDMAVSLFGSFSYSPMPEKVISEAMRLLKPGGRIFFMAYGPRYKNRRSYILNRHKIVVPHPELPLCRLKELFSCFDDLRITGLNALVEPNFERLPAQAIEFILRAEMATIGRINPDGCFFRIVTGCKPCHNGKPAKTFLPRG